MARPKKKGVDYFPHDCVTGKTIFILEQKFGNDGYALWFKLLEYLGTKEGHYLDCNDLEDMEFLQAKTRLEMDIICKILDVCANLNAIDRELWSKRIVWSQRFVDGISDVYVNRRVETPSKPNFYTISTVNNSFKNEFSEHPTPKSTQSKVKESKVEKSKLNGEHAPIGAEGVYLKKKVISKSEYMPLKKAPKPLKNPFTENFIPKWEEWKEFKKEQFRFTYKPIGEQSALDDLYELSGGDEVIAHKIIKQSKTKGWRGLFTLKNDFNGKTNQRESSTVGKTIEFDRP